MFVLDPFWFLFFKWNPWFFFSVTMLIMMICILMLKWHHSFFVFQNWSCFMNFDLFGIPQSHRVFLWSGKAAHLTGCLNAWQACLIAFQESCDGNSPGLSALTPERFVTLYVLIFLKEIWICIYISCFPQHWNSTCWYSLSRKTRTSPLHSDGLVQERRNSSALAMELHLSCINTSTCSISWLAITWLHQ